MLTRKQSILLALVLERTSAAAASNLADLFMRMAKRWKDFDEALCAIADDLEVWGYEDDLSRQRLQKALAVWDRRRAAS